MRTSYRSRPLLAAACAALLTACGGPGPQGPSPDLGTRIEPGTRVEGVIRDTTPTWGDRGRFHLYHFQAEAGERYAIDLRSENFDSYLTVGDRSGGLFNPLETNDDGGDGLNSLIRFTAPRTGTFVIMAQALGSDSDDIGIYTLGVEPLGPPTPAVATALAVGDAFPGTLRFDDPILEEDESNYDLYSFRARAGQRYAIDLRSDDFDTYLHLGPMRDGALAEVTQRDDDGGEGTDSRIIFTAPADGQYGIRARAFSSGSGPYTLTVTELPDPGPLEPRSIAYGETLSGALEIDDHMLDDGAYFDLYSFTGSAGDEVVIGLSSDDFDTYLSFGRMMGMGQMDVLDTDDDGGEGLDSELTVRLPSSGTFHIRAEALSSGETGSYRITLRRN